MPTDPASVRVCVVQDGARLHYAVPIALQRQGALARVYTDWYDANWVDKLAGRILSLMRPALARRMMERHAPELDARRVRSFPSLALQRLNRKRFKLDTDYYAHLRQLTARWILGNGFGGANGVFGF